MLKLACLAILGASMAPPAAAQGLLYSVGEGAYISYYASPRAQGVGDANGDGHGDFAIPRWPSPLETHVIEVRSGEDGSLLLSIEPDDFHDNYLAARNLAAAGDVDNDGALDLVSGRGMGSVYGGSVQIFSMSDGALIRQHDTAEVDFGDRVAGAVDLNQDGHDDYLVSSEVRATAFSGATGEALHAVGGNFFLLSSVTGTDDVDGDGFDDWAVGSRGSGLFGRVRMLSGQTGELLFELAGKKEYQRFGYSIAPVADLDGDDRSDLLIGSPSTSPSKAPTRAYAVSGASGETIRVWKGSADDGFGRTVCSPGDLDGDGVSDVLVGAPFTDLGGDAAGCVSAFSGESGDLLFSRLGSVAHEHLGQHVISGLGDVDDDAVPDFLANGDKTGEASFARVFSGGKADMLIGTGVTGTIEPSSAKASEIDEVYFEGVAGQKLKFTVQVLSGDLVPRLAIVDTAGDTLKKLQFSSDEPQTKSHVLKKTGTLRLRVRGLKKKSGTHSQGEYRIETDCDFLGKAGPQVVVRKGKPGKMLVVKVDALPGARLDAVIFPLKYEGPLTVPGLEAPDGQLVDISSFASLGSDGEVVLTSVPLASPGRYRLLLPAAAAGKSKVAFELAPVQPKGTGLVEAD